MPHSSPRRSLLLALAATLLSLLGVAAPASADLRIPTLGEATTISTMPDSRSFGGTIATDGNTTFVAYSEERGGIMLQRITSAGTEFGSNDTLQSPGTRSVGSPRVAVSGNNVYVAWLQYTAFQYEEHVVVATSRDGGRTFKPSVVAGQPTGHGAWDMAMDADGGNVFVSWSDDKGRLWTAGSRDAGRTFPCQAIISAPGDPTFGGGTYDLAVDGPRVHWTWMTDQYDIYARRSTDAGRTLGPVQRVRDGNAADYPGVPSEIGRAHV